MSKIGIIKLSDKRFHEQEAKRIANVRFTSNNAWNDMAW